MQKLFQNPEAVTADDVERALRKCADGVFVRTNRLGQSVNGRGIYALEVGSMYQPVVVVGGTHGMEWASVLVALRLAIETTQAVREKQVVHGVDLYDMLAGRGVAFLPLLNPDGFEMFRTGRAQGRRGARFEQSDLRYWQANARGVDINHNFAAGFYKAARDVAKIGIRRPGPTRYGGPFPFSEPESRAVRKLCEFCRPRALYSLHSQGEEIYWRYGSLQPEGSSYIASLLSSLTDYRLADPEGPASHAGLKDWFIKRYDRPGFTIELGLGKNPLPYEDFEDIWQRVERALYVGMIL